MTDALIALRPHGGDTTTTIDMLSLASFLTLVHLIGFALGAGGSTIKLVLLLKSIVDHTFGTVYLRIARPMARVVMLGLIMLIGSGVATLLFVGEHPFNTPFVVKLAAVATLLIIGLAIDNLADLSFKGVAPGSDQAPIAQFRAAQRLYLSLEIAATTLFYLIAVVWVLF